jgi:DNA-binding transcriptional MerR regulator
MSERLRVRRTFLTLEAVSRLSGVPLQRIRRYESEGLIVADHRFDDEYGEPLYEVSVVHRIRRIRSYEAIGVNLPGVDVILRLLDQLDRHPRRRRR